MHNKRWPQRRWPKLSSPWQGPFKICKVSFNSLQVIASPSLGGVIDVALHMCKKWTSKLNEDIFEEPEDEEEPPLLN